MRHWNGYEEARQNVQRMNLEQLLAHIDLLYGRENLRYGASEDEVCEEALKQTEMDWRVPVSYEGPLN